MAIKLDIVIPVYGEHEYLKQCLVSIDKAIEWNSAFDQFRITIADNGAQNIPINRSDFGRMRMSNYLRILPMSHNKMFAGAVNAAVQNCRISEQIEGEYYYLILNSDTILPGNFFNRILHIKKEWEIYGPKTNRCAGKQCDSRLNNKNVRIAADLWYENIAMVNELSSQVTTSNHGSEYVRWANGFCLMVKSSVFDKIGYFDAETFPLSGEEIDFCYRAHEKGIKMLIDHENFCWHFKGATVKSMEGLDKYWKVSADKLRAKYDYFPSQEIQCKNS